MKRSLCHWIYCTLVFASGQFVGIDETQPIYDTRKLTSEVIGFPTPNQLADLTLAEVEDLVEVLAPVLTPIYEAIGIPRCPTKTRRVTAQTRTTSILTVIKRYAQTVTRK